MKIKYTKKILNTATKILLIIAVANLILASTFLYRDGIQYTSCSLDLQSCRPGLRRITRGIPVYVDVKINQESIVIDDESYVFDRDAYTRGLVLWSLGIGVLYFANEYLRNRKKK